MPPPFCTQSMDRGIMTYCKQDIHSQLLRLRRYVKTCVLLEDTCGYLKQWSVSYGRLLYSPLQTSCALMHKDKFVYQNVPYPPP